MGGPTYILDANVFIEAARRYYAFDLAPGFWSGLVDHAEKGVIGSIDRVWQELDKGKDELARWASDSFSDAFRSTDETDVVESYKRVISWVQSQTQFSDAAKADSAGGADGWLVAYAMARGCIVVTHELPSAEIRRKVPIPNVCQEFDVVFVDTFRMMRDLKVRLA